jgi:hypothetical protein
LGNELFERINLHPPETIGQTLLLVGMVAAIGAVAWRRAGGPFALVAAALGLVVYVLLEPEPYILTAILLALLLSRRPVLDPSPRRRALDFLSEIAILAAGFVLYSYARTLVIGGYDEAVENAARIFRFENRLGLPLEATVQGWVLGNESLIRLLNRIYSNAFLATTIGVVVWLYLNNRRIYRMVRAGLGTAAAMTIFTIAVYPVAPPRLFPESGLVGTHELLGGHHSFLNPYAAVPSNHVGWMVLIGVALALSIRGWRGLAIGAVPPLTMGFVVIATGHHYWVDGTVGAAYALLPLAVLGARALWRRFSAFAWPEAETAAWLAHQKPEHGRLETGLGLLRRHVGSLLLALLLSYLLIGRVVSPGFTDFWGYQVTQVSITLLVIYLGESRRTRPALFTWETRAIVVATTFADSLGTAEDFYANYATYDKITHFGGTAAATAVAAEVIALLAKRGKVSWGPWGQVAVAVTFGFFCGVAWEVYEYLADVVFHTGRVQGVLDTRYDIVSDTAGAVVAALLVARRRAAEEERERAPAGELAEAD